MNSEAILKVEHWPIERLAPYPNNPRVNDAAVPRMADSIREFGFRIPIVAKSTGEVVDGHLRLKGALALGLSHVPVALADDLSPAQIKAFRLLANRSATWADWDFDLLKVELEALKLDGFSLDITGFDLKELSGLLETTAGATDPDDTPEPPANPVSRPGDLWIMGEHRLLCGDATAAADVARLLNGAKPHLMASDPPYGVNYDPAWRNAWRKRAGVSATERTGVVVNDHRADWREAWALFPGDVAYVWHNSVHDR